MFKYNELSDLLDGTLVKPLSKMEDGSIRCIDKDGNECFYEFDDFDFDKLPEERELSSGSLEDEIRDVLEEPKEEPKEEPGYTYDDLLKDMDDSLNDGTDIDYNEPEVPEIEVIEKEGFCDPLETESIVAISGIKTKQGDKYLIWKDII